MKRFILVIPVIIFPYIVAIPPLLLFYTSVTNMPIVDLPYLCVSYILALGCSVASIAVGLKKGWDAREMLRISRLVKLLHIPAYILIFPAYPLDYGNDL
ncbi:MAG: hypothetical protein FWF82_07475 [Oscillospiraceae bacterium]|nr:hypothetical protein [Oscillospiraceae bacterium]